MILRHNNSNWSASDEKVILKWATEVCYNDTMVDRQKAARKYLVGVWGMDVPSPVPQPVMATMSPEVPKNEQLKAYRFNLGFTQAEMAELLGVSLTHYNQVEVGKSSVSDKLWWKFINLEQKELES